MVDPLPSLGATTAVPGAAGLSPNVRGSGDYYPGAPDGYYNDGLHITVTGGANSPKKDVVSNPFSDTFERLWGVTPLFEKSAADAEKNRPTDPNGSDAGEEVIPGPVPISGNLDDLLKWLQENVPLLIVVGLVVLLGVYGVSAATGR